eukprot:2114206-Pleurochrysis_carterae.AAC.1
MVTPVATQLVGDRLEMAAVAAAMVVAVAAVVVVVVVVAEAAVWKGRLFATHTRCMSIYTFQQRTRRKS